MRKIIFILFVVSLFLLAGCSQKKEEPFPTELSEVAPDKAIGNVVRNTQASSCETLKTEAQKESCEKSLANR